MKSFPLWICTYFLFWQNISLQSLKCNIKNVVSQLWIFNLSPCKISLNIHAFAFVQSFPMHWWMMERSSDWNLLKKILKNPNAGSWISKDDIMVWRKVRIISILFFFTVGTFMFVPDLVCTHYDEISKYVGMYEESRPWLFNPQLEAWQD